jgi:hypothetical protein
LRIDLKPAQHRHVEVAAADQSKGHRAVERAGVGQSADRPPACVRQRRMRDAFFGDRSGPDQAIL